MTVVILCDKPRCCFFNYTKLNKRDIKRIEQQMRKLVRNDPDLLRDAQLLEGIYWVGFITAVTVLAELGDLRRFEHARQLTAFAGICPRNAESGTSVHKKLRMSKKGSSRIRKALYMPALTVIRGQNDLAELYAKLVAEGKTPKAALGVVMRKLLLVMRAVLISGEKYQCHYRPCAKLRAKTPHQELVYA